MALLIIGLFGYLIYDKKKSEIDAENKVTAGATSDKSVLNELTLNWDVHDRDDVFITTKGIEQSTSGYVLNVEVVNNTGKGIIVSFDRLAIGDSDCVSTQFEVAADDDSVTPVNLETGDVTADIVESARSISIDYSVLDAKDNSQITHGGTNKARSN